jgi:hypothetical protein
VLASLFRGTGDEFLGGQIAEPLRCPKELGIVPGATHLFEEPGTLEEVARLAKDWLVHRLTCEAVEPRAPATTV